MSEQADRVPTWVGKVVDTSELSVPELPDNDSISANRADSMSTANSPAPVDRQIPERAVRPFETGSESTGLAPYQGTDRARPGLLAAALFGVSAAVVVGLALLAFNNQADRSTPVGVDRASDDSTNVTDIDAVGDGESGDANSLDVSGEIVEEASTDEPINEDASTEAQDPTSMELFQREATARSRDAYGVFAAGRLHVLGTWSDQESAETLGDRASILVGSQNVVYDAEYTDDADDTTEEVSPVLFIDQPLVFADQANTLDAASAFLFETAGALMAIYPDARLTVIVPGLQKTTGSAEESQAAERVDALVASLQELGVPADRISVEASAATTDGSEPPFAMLSGGLFVG